MEPTWVIKFGLRVLHDVGHLFEQYSIFSFNLRVFTYTVIINSAYDLTQLPSEPAELASHANRASLCTGGGWLT